MRKSIQPTVAHDSPAVRCSQAERVSGVRVDSTTETLAVEEPLEIQLGYGTSGRRTTKSISVTMRTPGHDVELATGFLMTEGVVRDVHDIAHVSHGEYREDCLRGDDIDQNSDRAILPRPIKNNTVRVDLYPDVLVNLANLERNFYMTSSCGICGKASLLALRSVSPPRRRNEFSIDVDVLYALPDCMRRRQSVFDRTGGLHAAALFSAKGELLGLREDVGRHNAVDKLLGREFLADRTPLRNALMLLSGRASFELLQKAVMSGIQMIASVGAPSSLAVEVAKEFDIALVGFLRDEYFNVYHGSEHLSGLVPQGSNVL
ncbi:formate dehydrogenase accessory sulfurtransferase FdhD [Edaphobacter flagellatus]|uniref:formate dehydrogenase accessory sulfurtransferase FdhD n=1 Tax=Edaphobacter flagellatus TaxID=1933044 RepID=UPI0021B40B48|nr:formate dehydrogenase accessory sulfurtransferase FdhD [Edaphobacter flagellatus]